MEERETMKKLFNKKAFALVLCLVLALTALFTVTAFADTEPADGAAVTQTEETSADSSVSSAKAIASAIAIGVAAAGGAMMLGLVFLETAIIYALLVVILIIFVL